MKRLTFVVILIFLTQAHAQQIDFALIDFRGAERNAKNLKGEDLHNLPILTYRLTQNLNSDAERFRAIYYWVCHNIKGDYHMYNKAINQRRRYKSDAANYTNWSSTYDDVIFKELLENKTTICIGYAYLVKEMAKLANLDCEIVIGHGKSSSRTFTSDFPDHAWNAIKLNGKWYLCDATWSAGIIDETYVFNFDFEDKYFLLDPEIFAKNHTPIDEKWLLLRNSEKYK